MVRARRSAASRREPPRPRPTAGTRPAAPRPSRRGAGSACGPGDSGAADTRSICSTPRSASSSSSADERRRPIAQPVRLAPPVPVGRKLDRVGVGRQRHRQRAGHGVRQVIPCPPRSGRSPSARRSSAAAAVGRRNNSRAGLRRQGDDQIAVRVEIVRGDHELAEPAAGRDCRRATPRTAAPDRRGAGCFSCAAPRIRSHSTRQHASRPLRAESGDAAPAATTPPRARRVRARSAAVRPRRSPAAAASTSRPAAAATSAAPPARRPLRHAEVRADEARRAANADHPSRKSSGNTSEPRAHAASAAPRWPSARPSAHAATRNPRRHGIACRARRPPEPLRLPEPLRAVDGREQRADDADAAAGDDVDLDAGLLQRAQHAGVIRAGRAGAGQDERGAKLGGVGFGGGARVTARSFRRFVVNRRAA